MRLLARARIAVNFVTSMYALCRHDGRSRLDSLWTALDLLWLAVATRRKVS